MGFYYLKCDRMNTGLKCAKVFLGYLRSPTWSSRFDICDGQPSIDLANLVQDNLNFHIFFFDIPSIHWFHLTLLDWTIPKTTFLGPYYFLRLDQLFTFLRRHLKPYIAQSSIPFTPRCLIHQLWRTTSPSFLQPALTSTNQVAAAVLRTSIMFGANYTFHLITGPLLYLRGA